MESKPEKTSYLKSVIVLSISTLLNFSAFATLEG